MGRVDPSDLPGPEGRHIDLSLQIASPRTGRSGGADQGDLPDAGALWVPPRARAAAPGGLAHQPQEDLSYLSRDGPAIAQQDAQAEGQGEAAGRPQGCHRTEPDVGDGLRPRSAGDRAEAAGADGGRYLLALLTGDRSALHVSRRGRGPDPGAGLRRGSVIRRRSGSIREASSSRAISTCGHTPGA